METQIMNVRHEQLTDQQQFERLKECYKERELGLMCHLEWKRLRKIQLKKEGKSWSS